MAQIAPVGQARPTDRPQPPAKSRKNIGHSGDDRLASLSQNLDGGATTNDLTLGFPSYNPAGQITSQSTSNDLYAFTERQTVNRAYAVNGLNQYTSAGPATFTYDANGNLTSDGSVNYVYDAENRLVATSGAKTASLLYDPLGRLVRIHNGNAANARWFIYDGDDLVAEYDGSGNMLRRYVHGPGADEPLAWLEGSGDAPANRRDLITDYRGSIIAITNSSGATQAINRYDEFGIPQSGNVGRFQYTGQAWLAEVGLYHYKARVYSSSLGRFLQTDPVGYDDQVNLYAYVGNDPINSADPSGMRSKCAISGACEESGLQGMQATPAIATSVTGGSTGPAMSAGAMRGSTTSAQLKNDAGTPAPASAPASSPEPAPEPSQAGALSNGAGLLGAGLDVYVEAGKRNEFLSPYDATRLKGFGPLLNYVAARQSSLN